MNNNLSAIVLTTALGLGLYGCDEPEPVNTINVKIVKMEDFTYSAGYGNGCRFTVQIVNNTENQLKKLEAFVTEDDKFLFSVSGELPPMGSLQRTHDVQQNRRCNEISETLDLRKNRCDMNMITQDECFASLQLSIDA